MPKTRLRASVVPMLLATDLQKIADFYADLGFAIEHSQRNTGCPKHVQVSRGGFSLSFFYEPVGTQMPILTGTIYIFSEGLDALAKEWSGKTELLWGPELSPRGLYEFGVADPDDYYLAFAEQLPINTNRLKALCPSNAAKIRGTLAYGKNYPPQ